MDAQIKELRNALKLKECQLNTQKLMVSAAPLKAEITEMKRKLQEYSRDKEQIQQELNETLQLLEKERKERRRHCTQCIRHSRQQNARFDKAVQVYQPTDIVPGQTATKATAPTAAVSLSIFATSTQGTTTSDGQMVTLKARVEEQQQQYQHLMAKYEKMKQLCRIRNETITALNQGIMEKENENVNVNRIQVRWAADSGIIIGSECSELG